MALHQYSVWFRATDVPANHEDHEWVACFIVDADSPGAAQAWGDHLAQKMCKRSPENVFLLSQVEAPDKNALLSLPQVREGELVSDEIIGW